MATAAFKSSTKRTNNPPPDQPKPRLRRSLSVSAVSRSSSTQQIELEFLNKRDNPLYWATGGGGGSPTADNKTQNPTPVAAVTGGGVLERGRSVNRNSDLKNGGQKVEIGGRRRSLSRVKGGTGGGQNVRRGRSVSRANLASESEAAQESRILNTRGDRSGSSIRASSTTGKLAISRSSHPSRHPSVGSSFDSHVSNWEDGISTSSLSEAEEKTIKAVYEQMKSFEGDNLRKDTASSEIYETVRSEVRRAIADIQDDLQDAIRRNTAGVLVNADITDISPKLVKPGAVELVLDIRREYAKELEEAQERARKLRTDLAIEEHRKQELSRILKETLPEPKTSSSHRSRLGRKSSSERKKMSKRLTDEALSYFDECVSISTFDSSDFSAAEDPSVNSAAITPPKRVTTDPNHCIDQQIIHGDPGSSSVANSSSNEVVIDRVDVTPDNTACDRKCRFSFGHKPTESLELQRDFKTYVKTFEKDKGIDAIFSERSRDNYNVDVYNLLDVNESLLFDKVFFKNRQESGSLHICGGLAIPFLPLGHLF